MAESQLKRQRDHHHEHEEKNDDYSKRHKSYTDILSILEQEEDEPNQDLSDIFTSLQQELSSSSSSSPSYDSTAVDKNSSCVGSGSGSDAESVNEICCGGGVDDAGNNVDIEGIEEDERVRVMRHLLEASDDELGIPNRVEESGEEENESGEQKQQQQLFLSGDWKWQFEDDAANYYTFMELQSELFI